MTRRIYLDFNGSTPLDPAVREAMEPYLTDHYGNPSAGHWAASEARDAIERARGQVASLVGSDPTEIVFTSGGTESNNMALKGAFFAWRRERARPHFITSAVEHPSILEPLKFLERWGASITVLNVDRHGQVDPDDVRRAIRPRTILVSIMHANNEVGTIQPIAEIGKITREHSVIFHTDAAQSAGKINIDVEELQVDLLSIAGHKLYAPKGVGALYVREGVRLENLLHGGLQEAGHRAGTESAPLIVALGAACGIARHGLKRASDTRLRDLLWELLQERFGEGVVLNGHFENRLPNTLNVSMVGFQGRSLLGRMEGVAASTGSACHAGQVTASPVLTAMGVRRDVALGAIRFSLGRFTTEEEVREVVERLAAAIAAERERGAENVHPGSAPSSASGKRLSEMSPDEIMSAVADRYSQVATSPDAKFNFPVGRAFAESVGYPPDLLDRLPAGFSDSFTGAGNPQPFVDAKPGEIVLDLGCGAGLDLYFYARAVGPTGKVYGLDFSSAMIRKARANLRAAGITTVELLEAAADAIPLPDASVDLVTANGIYNLSPDKETVMREVARVLRPGGRTVFAEILAKEELPQNLRSDVNDWFRCIGGALTQARFFQHLRSAGLANPQILWLGRNARTGHPLSVCAVIRAVRG
jgi:cysteine desulfurase